MTKILIVEDNEMNRDMLSRRLRKKGFQVECATNGLEGIDKTLEIKPDVVLMDLSLPEMDGWEATEKIKDNEEIAHIPVIALTAHAMSGDREKALKAGCEDYDTKPVDLNRLLEKIQRLVGDEK